MLAYVPTYLGHFALIVQTAQSLWSACGPRSCAGTGAMDVAELLEFQVTVRRVVGLASVGCAILRARAACSRPDQGWTEGGHEAESEELGV